MYVIDIVTDEKKLKEAIIDKNKIQNYKKKNFKQILFGLSDFFIKHA